MKVLVSLHAWTNLKREKKLEDKGPAHKRTERKDSEWLVGELETSSEEKWNTGKPATAGDCATSRSVKAFQFGNVGSSKKKIISVKHKWEIAEEKLCIKERETPWRVPIKKQRYNVRP